MFAFQGHDVLALVLSSLLAVVGVVNVFSAYVATLKINKIIKVILWLGYALITPNCAYLMLEIRHVLLHDNIADESNLLSWWIFGGLGAFGLMTTVLVVVLTAYLIGRTYQARILIVLVLSALQATGASMGLLNVASGSVILDPRSVLIAVIRIVQSAHRLEFVIGLTIFIAVVSLTAVWFERRFGVLVKIRP